MSKQTENPDMIASKAGHAANEVRLSIDMNWSVNGSICKGDGWMMSGNE